MEAVSKEQSVGFWRAQGENIWVYAVWPPERSAIDFLGYFGVDHSTLNELKGDTGVLKGIGVRKNEVLAIVGAYSPNSELVPEKAKITSLEKILDDLTFDLALNGAKAVVINNDNQPDYGQAAQKLGFSQLHSGLCYVKPSLEVNVSLEKYLPRPDLKSMVGMYILNISLKPSWNSQERKVGKQFIDLVPVRRMYDWCKRAMGEHGLTDNDLVAEFGGKHRLDCGLGSKIPGFLINSELKTAIDYFGKVTKVIKQQGQAKGIDIEVRPGYSGEHWCYWSLEALESLGYTQIDPLKHELPGSGIFFKKV